MGAAPSFSDLPFVKEEGRTKGVEYRFPCGDG